MQSNLLYLFGTIMFHFPLQDISVKITRSAWLWAYVLLMDSVSQATISRNGDQCMPQLSALFSPTAWCSSVKFGLQRIVWLCPLPNEGLKICKWNLWHLADVFFLPVRDKGSIPGLGRSLGVGNGNPLQYSSLENPMDRSLAATVHRVAKSDTAERLSMHACNPLHTLL